MSLLTHDLAPDYLAWETSIWNFDLILDLDLELSAEIMF